MNKENVTHARVICLALSNIGHSISGCHTYVVNVQKERNGAI
jgi:hypothetical protein